MPLGGIGVQVTLKSTNKSRLQHGAEVKPCPRESLKLPPPENCF